MVADNTTLEFSVSPTNEIEPYRETRILSVMVYNESLQFDASLSQNELDSLIDYLTRCRNYISEFNANTYQKTI